MSGQLALSEFDKPEPKRKLTPRWTDWHVYKKQKRHEEREKETRICQNCRKKVSAHFAKVFGDNDDTAHACRKCASYGSVVDGAAADPTIPIIPQGGEFR